MVENFAEKAMKNMTETASKLQQQINDTSKTKGPSGRPDSQQTKLQAQLSKKGTNFKQQQQMNKDDIAPHTFWGKDPKDIKSHEWYQMYGEISTKLESQLEENKKLHEDLIRRQERYIKREQEYRKHIDDLQRELRVRYGYESEAWKKNLKIIDALKGQLHENIDGIQPKTKKLKEEQEKDIVRKFNSELSKMKKKIEERKSQKGDQAADLKDRENELHHHLELITNIAQRIDNENRALMKKNTELKQEYKAQENDRELLVKQLVMQKKENAKIKEEIEFYEKIIEEKEEEEELDVDRIDTQSHAQQAFNQSKFTEPKGLGLNQQTRDNQSKTAAQRSQVNTRGTNRTHIHGGVPLVYIPNKKMESEEEKIRRYERVVEKLKKMLENERKQLKQARMQYQREISSKTELEHLLKETVEAVKMEKAQNRRPSTQGQKFMMPNYQENEDHAVNGPGNQELNQQDRERVIELLLSQERVISLLYEKTFPMTSSDLNQMNYTEQQQNKQGEEQEETENIEKE